MLEDRFDEFIGELRELHQSMTEDLKALRRFVDSLNDHPIAVTTFSHKEIERVWEQLRAS